MAHFGLLVQAEAMQLVRLWCRPFMSHENLVEICKKSNMGHLFSCKSSPRKSLNFLDGSRACQFFNMEKIVLASEGEHLHK
jgi:hypothetical protein